MFGVRVVVSSSPQKDILLQFLLRCFEIFAFLVLRDFLATKIITVLASSISRSRKPKMGQLIEEQTDLVCVSPTV